MTSSMFIILPLILVVGGIAVMVFMWVLRAGQIHHTTEADLDVIERLSTAANEPAEGAEAAKTDDDSKQNVA